MLQLLRLSRRCVRLIKDLNRFDVLRCDKSTVKGKEFMQTNNLEHYMSIPAEMKIPKGGGRWFLENLLRIRVYYQKKF